MRTRWVGRLADVVIPWVAIVAVLMPATAFGQAPAAESEDETVAVVRYVQELLAGTAAPPDGMLAWEPSFVRSQGAEVYVPFTVQLDAGQLSGTDVAMYYSISRQGPQVVSVTVTPDEDDASQTVVEGQVLNTAAAAVTDVVVRVFAQDAADTILEEATARVSRVASGQRAPFRLTMTPPEETAQYNAVVDGAPEAFREFAIVDVPAARDSVIALSRAFVATPGDYDVYLALRERPTAAAPTGPKVALLREKVQVPDLSNELAASTVFLAERIDQLSAPLNQEDQLARPYTFGTMAITPTASSRHDQDGELSFVFFIYNAQADADNKPNVSVEYNFHIQEGARETFFNRTSPQAFNGQTLPPEFNLTLGHQLVAGQSVPLASFDPGDYRLEVVIEDELAGATLRKDVLFTVVDSE